MILFITTYAVKLQKSTCLHSKYASQTYHLPQTAPAGQKPLSNEQKLEFYGLFKQATEGENKTKQPGRLKMVERMKWDTWKKLGTMSKEEAMKTYVDKLAQIVPTWNQQAKL